MLVVLTAEAPVEVVAAEGVVAEEAKSNCGYKR